MAVARNDVRFMPVIVIYHGSWSNSRMSQLCQNVMPIMLKLCQNVLKKNCARIMTDARIYEKICLNYAICQKLSGIKFQIALDWSALKLWIKKTKYYQIIIRNFNIDSSMSSFDMSD